MANTEKEFEQYIEQKAKEKLKVLDKTIRNSYQSTQTSSNVNYKSEYYELINALSEVAKEDTLSGMSDEELANTKFGWAEYKYNLVMIINPIEKHNMALTSDGLIEKHYLIYRPESGKGMSQKGYPLS